MATISVSLPSDGTAADVADYNNPINTIVTAINGNLDSTNLSANAVSTAKVADGAITPAKLLSGTGSTWVWQSSSPSYVNLTVGNGTVVSKYTQVGKQVTWRFAFTLGSTSSISGAFTVSLPVTSATDYVVLQPLGVARFDNVGVEAYDGQVCWASTTTVGFQAPNLPGDTRLVPAAAGKPVGAWGTGDTLMFTITYEAA